MSIFSISDITSAGAFANAITAANDSDNRHGDRYVVPGEASKVTGFLAALVRGIAATIIENLPASRPASRPA